MNVGTTRLTGRPKNRWQDDVRKDGQIVGGEGWQGKVYNREEWKKLLRMARNRHIMHMPMELMNDWMNGGNYKNFGTMYESHFQGWRSPLWISSCISGSLKVGPIHCSVMSVRNYHHVLRNNQEEYRSHLLHSEAWNFAINTGLSRLNIAYRPTTCMPSIKAGI